jgi:hypothetical protein
MLRARMTARCSIAVRPSNSLMSAPAIKAFSSDDDDADRRIVTQLIERVGEFFAGPDVEGVQFVRTVDRDDREAIIPFDQYIFGHDVFLLRWYSFDAPLLEEGAVMNPDQWPIMA